DSYFLFLSNGHPLHRTLHSFPTRRSSDLIFGVIRGLAGCRFMAVGRAPRFRKELSMNRKMPPLQMNKLCILGSWSQCMRKNERRSEEHTSELQSLRHLVCRLLLEKKKINN